MNTCVKEREYLSKKTTPPPANQERQWLHLTHRKSNKEERVVAIISVLAAGGGRGIECCQFGIFTKNCWQQLFSYFRENLRENRGGENSHKLTTSIHVMFNIKKAKLFTNMWNKGIISVHIFHDKRFKAVFCENIPEWNFSPIVFRVICVRREQMRAAVWKMDCYCAETWIIFAKL